MIGKEGVAVDGTHVYFVHGDNTTQEIYHAPKGVTLGALPNAPLYEKTGLLPPHIDGPQGIQGLTVDDHHVFFGNLFWKFFDEQSTSGSVPVSIGSDSSW